MIWFLLLTIVICIISCVYNQSRFEQYKKQTEYMQNMVTLCYQNRQHREASEWQNKAYIYSKKANHYSAYVPVYLGLGIVSAVVLLINLSF